MKDRIVAVLVAALALGLAPFASVAEATPVTRAPAAYVPAPITWTDCSADWGVPGFECGTLVVPLDYAQPDGRKVHLAVTRIQHTSDDADYQGVMIGNPGGPGGSGTWIPVLAGYVPGTAASTYDWIGFDPRGVGESTPTLRCDSHYFHVDRTPYVPWTSGVMKTWRSRAAGYARSCTQASAARLLDHMKTTDTVQDLESLRVALGQQKINYYGFSYGTYLGQVYATLHPDRVGRFVLDGNVDPGRVWYSANLDQDIAFGKAMTAFWTWMAAHASTYQVSTDWRVIRHGYYKEISRLKKDPWHRALGADELNDVMVAAGYGVYDWETIASAFSTLRHTHNGRPMLRLFKQGGYGDDNGYAVYNATQCTDVQWPTTWRTWVDDTWNTHLQRPFLAWNNTWYNAPCFTWGADAGTPVNVTGADVTAPILLVNETRDAATPYSGALEVRRRFPTASLIAGVGGTTHAGSLSGVSCTDDAIAAYLADGTVPTRTDGDGYDLGCPPVPAPGSDGARSVTGGLPLKWRHKLVAAAGR